MTCRHNKSSSSRALRVRACIIGLRMHANAPGILPMSSTPLQHTLTICPVLHPSLPTNSTCHFPASFLPRTHTETTTRDPPSIHILPHGCTTGAWSPYRRPQQPHCALPLGAWMGVGKQTFYERLPAQHWDVGSRSSGTNGDQTCGKPFATLSMVFLR